jgi:hypothetical protein
MDYLLKYIRLLTGAINLILHFALGKNSPVSDEPLLEIKPSGKA